MARVVEKSYTMRYLNGSAFFNDYFIVMCFLPSWKEIIFEKQRPLFFSKLEKRLNALAKMEKGLQMTIPLVCCTFKKK